MTWWIELSEIVRNLGLIVAGAVGLLLAGMRVIAANRQADAAIRQAELARRDHVAELFNRAVGQLHDDILHVRLGAIYTLRQINRDFPDLADSVFDILNLYVRESDKKYGDNEPPEDIRAIFKILVEQMDHVQ